MHSQLNEKLQKVAVVGACGKMGRGIALVILQEMTLIALDSDPAIRSSFHLDLIDPYEQGFYDLKVYLEQQLTKFAEKNINYLRELYLKQEDLIGNGEIVSSFVSVSLRFVNCTTELSVVKKASLIFEAALEEIPLKTQLLREIRRAAPAAWVFTNTSSIPIGLLAQNSGIDARIIGYHFYNPPSIQKLLEIIPWEKGDPDLTTFALDLAKRLKKIVVISKDVAGFIGNGHFAREIVFACQLVIELCKEFEIDMSIQIVDAATRDFLLRPMGIFQLLDFVGLPVAHNIIEIICEYVPDKAVKAVFIEGLMLNNLYGGQTLEGFPKDGIYQYDRGKITGIFSFETKDYAPLADLSFLGRVPDELTWKKLQKDPQLIQKLPEYFEKLFSTQDQGAVIAARFLKRSFEIETLLVETGVASSMKDVSTVIKNGFYHAYSPDEIIK